MYRNCFLKKEKKGKTGVFFFRLDFVCVCVLLPLLLLRIYIDSQWLYYWYTSIHSHFIVAFLYRAVIAGISTAYRFLRVRACIDIGRNFDPVTRNFGFPGVSKCFSVEMSTISSCPPCGRSLLTLGRHIFF